MLNVYSIPFLLWHWASEKPALLGAVRRDMRHARLRALSRYAPVAELQAGRLHCSLAFAGEIVQVLEYGGLTPLSFETVSCHLFCCHLFLTRCCSIWSNGGK